MFTRSPVHPERSAAKSKGDCEARPSAGAIEQELSSSCGGRVTFLLRGHGVRQGSCRVVCYAAVFIGDALKQHFPQVLDWFERRDTLVFCDFLDRWPTLAQVKHARAATHEDFFHDHNVRRAHLIAERVDCIRHAMPLTEDVAVIQS